MILESAVTHRVFGAALMSCSAVFVAAEAQSAVIRVSDDQARPVPYAVVGSPRGTTQIADSLGKVVLSLSAGDSVQVRVRRIGYREFFGWTRRSKNGEYPVTLAPVARPIDGLEVWATANTPLARTGFYDRVERVRRGAFVAELIPPEELEARNALTFSRFLEGRRSVRVARTRDGQAVLLGRGGCGMTIIVDGKRLHGMIEEEIVGEAPQSINPQGTMPLPGGLTIDRVVSGSDVMAIEVYPSTANAPAELIPLGGRGSCGMVVIWTGGRH